MKQIFGSISLFAFVCFFSQSVFSHPPAPVGGLLWPGADAGYSCRMEMRTADRFNQEVFRYVNEMRQDPKGFYHKYIPSYIKSHPGRFTAQYTHSLKKSMLSSTPLPLFETSPALKDCASRQYKYLARFKGRQLTHEQGDISFAGRMKQAGLHCLAENLYDADDPKALDVVLDLLIDQNISSLGHRRNLMNPMYTHLGIVSGTPAGGRTIVVMDFGCKNQ